MSNLNDENLEGYEDDEYYPDDDIDDDDDDDIEWEDDE